ncbi:MAG: PAS domain S-box protein [Deltaproteobacteria bacterium]|nr:PAS domain S-box protein [Deltaproteobacteria bacterium]
MAYNITQKDTLKNLYRISSLITETSSLDNVLTEIMKTVDDEIGLKRAAIFFVNSEKELLECKLIVGVTPEQEKLAMTKPFNLKKHDCMETKVALTSNPVFVTDFYSDPGVTGLDIVVTENMERGSTLYVPLKIKDDVIGVFEVDKRESKINNHEFEAMCIYADYISIAVKNSEIYESLLKERNFSKNVFNSSINGMLTVDNFGRITSINVAGERILDVKKERCNGKFIKEAMQTIPESGLDQMIDYVFSGQKETRGYKFKFKNKAGRNIILDVKASPILDDRDAVTGILFSMEDVAEERERIKYLQRLNRLVSLGELAAGVAHGIRNPLTGIEIVMDVLRRDEELSESSKELAQEVSSEIDRVEQLVSDLLDFARPKKFTFDMVKINDVIESTKRLINEKCQTQHIKFVVQYGKDLPTLFIDFEMMRQAILNIAINCIRAMPNGGELRIETNRSMMENDMKEKIQSVSILIKDNGVGIPESIKDRIFDPFFTTHKEGTGLGLSVTHSIVTEHNGIILVDSEEGKGTMFNVSLPVDLWEGFS